MMKGPQLDARSYTILMLIVIASVLSINSFAQRSNQDNSTLTDAGATIGLANATRDVADATREVAKANLEIARQLQAVAKALGELKDNKSGTAAAAVLTTEGSAEGEVIPAQNPNGVNGTIEIN